MKWLDRLHAVVAAIVQYFLIAREFMVSHFHPFMPFIYVLSVIVTGALIWFTFYCISASNWVKSKIIEKGMDYFSVGDVGKYRLLKVWKHVIARMKTNNPSNWKLAIMEADELMDEVIKSSGYRAATIDERFKQAESGVFPTIDQLRDAHQVRVKLNRDPEFNVTKEEAMRVLRIYQQAFKENGLLD